MVDIHGALLLRPCDFRFIRCYVNFCNLFEKKAVDEESLFTMLMKGKMEAEVVDAELVLPNYLSFKRVQMYEKYPKGQARGRHWKHLKQIIQAENYQNYPPDEPNCELLVLFSVLSKEINLVVFFGKIMKNEQ